MYVPYSKTTIAWWALTQVQHSITEQDSAKYLFNFTFNKKINVVQKFSLLLKYLKSLQFHNIHYLSNNQSIPLHQPRLFCGCKRRLYSRTALSSTAQYRYN